MLKTLVLTAAIALPAAGCCCGSRNACTYAPVPSHCDDCQSGAVYGDAGAISGPAMYGSPGTYDGAPITVGPGPG